jgi:gas vesicle protein
MNQNQAKGKPITQQEEPMKETGKYNTGHIVLAVLGGAAAGAAVALLMAPKSGRETRHQLDGYFETAKEKVSRIPEAIISAATAAEETMSQEIAMSKHAKRA